VIEVRRSHERGRAEWGWLSSRHTFSFAGYRDPAHMGFRDLRVVNEDRVAPGRGFETHAHRDMEIVSYVIAGALEHRDSLGNGSVIRPGDVQRMTAGTGVTHSEFNPSSTEPVHFLQIWVLPERAGLEPDYQQAHFGPEVRRGAWRLVTSRDGREGSVVIHQDCDLYASILEAGSGASFALRPGRHAWLQVVTGELALAEAGLSAGDGVAISGEPGLDLEARARSEVLLFDLR
jgi:redox-sensitive bicupin YhaK (pirin superfamily)